MPRSKLATAFLSATILALSTARPVSAASRVRIKIATLAPDGTSWMLAIRRMNKEVAEKTNGSVRFKIYPGGVQGDEKDVLRKIRSGQLHGGAFTGLGMGALFPDTLVVAVPTLVRNYEEVDLIKEKLGGYFVDGIDKNGFVLLGWQEVGFVYLLSTKPITTAEDLRQSRIWAWEGDQVAPAVFREGKIMPVYLAVQDVLPALQTGLIDAAYSSPFGAVALQWHTKVKYMTDMPLTYAL
ncbi:MAG: TRAP transporter substrate-binding protein DctP, partial [Lentisphaerae bacterium]|nr:TRAP transporter substrate-binding protein DctP [Lentisphaerota bacterium]